MQKAFTLIEILIVMAIMIILSIVAITSLSGKKRTVDLANTVEQIAGTLREAQSRSVAESQGVSWGVHFANTTATPASYAFFTTAYSTATVVGYYRLPATVQYVTSTLSSGSSTDVIFSQITGLASASTTIGLNLVGKSNTSLISVASSGAVSY